MSSRADSVEVRLRPEDIRFTHGRISLCFSDGKLVDDTIGGCLAGAVRFEDLPPPRVVRNPRDGHYYSLSNRRLYVARVLGRRGFRFGLHGDSELVKVREFDFADEHVQAQWRISCRTLGHGGRFVVSAWRCGSCKQRHDSKYLDEHVPPEHLPDLRSAARRELAERQLRLLGGSDSELLSDEDDEDPHDLW